MQQNLWKIVIGMGLMGLSGDATAEDKVPPVVRELVQSTLMVFGSDPVIVSAVKNENAKGKTLQEIQARDKKWRENPGISQEMEAIMSSPCALRLKAIQKELGILPEIFVMDRQGANVCMTDKTSDPVYKKKMIAGVRGGSSPPGGGLGRSLREHRRVTPGPGCGLTWD